MKDKLYEIQATLWFVKEALKKAIKPGPTLDYSEINPRQNAPVNEKAKAIADTNASTSQQNAPAIDYHNDRMKSPSRYAGAADKAKAVRAKIEQQMKPKTALETFEERGQVKKGEDCMAKDELDEKIKAKLRAEMDKRGFGEADATRHIIDRDRGEAIAKLPKPPKPKKQDLN